METKTSTKNLYLLFCKCSADNRKQQRRYDDENDSIDKDKVIRTHTNAPNRLTKRMSKQYYRKALCIAWSDTHMNNNDSDSADAWTAYYTEQ